MILSDTAIIEAIQTGDIVIEPFKPEHINPNSYDVCLSDTIRVYTASILDAKEHNETATMTIPEQGIILIPGVLYLCSTVERVNSRLYRPSINGKSSIGRLGISIHVTAGYGDVGFSGNSWTLEMTVIKPIRVYAGMKIGQIEFSEVRGEVAVPYDKKPGSKYNGDNVAKESMNYKNYTDE
jgi:dCTP deaminase